jgi:hypothetical protein
MLRDVLVYKRIDSVLDFTGRARDGGSGGVVVVVQRQRPE